MNTDETVIRNLFDTLNQKQIIGFKT